MTAVPESVVAPGDLSSDEVFDVLSNHRRRYVLQYLRENGDATATLRELSEQVAARENGCQIEELTRQQRKRVSTSLHQTHLPKMDRLGIVDYDARGIVSQNAAVTQLEVYLELVPAGDLSWSELYLGLAGVSTVLVVVAWLDLLPTTIPDILYAALIVAAFAVAAVAHAVATSRARLGDGTAPAEDERDGERAPGVDR